MRAWLRHHSDLKTAPPGTRICAPGWKSLDTVLRSIDGHTKRTGRYSNFIQLGISNLPVLYGSGAMILQMPRWT